MIKSNHCQQLVTSIISMLLVLLWSYTTFSKLADVDDFKRQLHNQNFSIMFADLLLWVIPISELAAAILLILAKTRFWGMVSSFLLLIIFTGYIGLVVFGFFDRTPCSCGGVLRKMGWQTHLWFNVVFLSFSAIGTWLLLPANIRNNNAKFFERRK